MNNPELLINIPVAIALITVVGMFLKHISSERKLDRAMFENHLKMVTGALQVLSGDLREEIAHQSDFRSEIRAGQEQRDRV